MNSDNAAIASGAYTSTQTTASLNNATTRYLIAYLNVTAVPASPPAGLQVRLFGVDSAESLAVFPLGGAPIEVTATGQYAYIFGPGATSFGGSVGATAVVAVPVPYTFKLSVVVPAGSGSWTFSLGYSLIE